MRWVKWAMLIISLLLIANALWLGITTNMHHGHFLQIAFAVVIAIYALLLHKIAKKWHIIAGLALAVPLSFMIFVGIYGNVRLVNFNEDVVIVLGAGLSGENVGTHLARRLDVAIDYLNENQQAVVVVTGGVGIGQSISEAEAMRRYLVQNGIADNRIIKEDASTRTLDNLAFAQEILVERFPDGFRAVLVSNDFHIFRVVSMARSLGLGYEAVGLGAATPLLTLPVNYIRELAAIIHFWIFGW